MKIRRRKRRGATLIGLAWDAGMLALESQQVIGLRVAKLLRGGAGAKIMMRGACLAPMIEQVSLGPASRGAFCVGETVRLQSPSTTN